MRIECESCKDLVIATFAVDAGVVTATCSACHATMSVSTTAATVDVPVATCPKCGASRRDEAACPSCGLDAGRMSAFADARDGAVPEVVLAAWQRVLDGWGDAARHDELIQLIAAHNCYAWAAGRYRDAVRAKKGDPIGERQLERLRRAAEATLMASASVRRDPKSAPYRATTTVLAMLVVAICAGVLYAMVIRDRGTSHTGEATPATPAAPLRPGAPVRALDPARPMHPTGP